MTKTINQPKTIADTDLDSVVGGAAYIKIDGIDGESKAADRDSDGSRAADFRVRSILNGRD
ncbi:MAG: hypothetical protein ACFB03_10540 [Paracoccaceae bacterium]